MAMRFSQAQRAENPDLAKAMAMQEQQSNALRAQEENEKASLRNAGVELAVASPEGTFQNPWDVAMGNPTTSQIAADSATAGGSEALGEAAISEGLLAQGGETAALEAAASEAALAETALAAEGAGAVGAGATGAGAAGAGAAGGGMSGALASMGPMGWAALAALALSAG